MKKKDLLGILIMVLVAMVAAGFGFLGYILVSADNIDPETLCRIGEDDPVTKIIIDKTDPWNKPCEQRLARLIRKIKTRLSVHERLSIHILDETGTYSPSPVFDMCNPGSERQANELYQNPRMMEKRFEAEFSAPLDNLLSTLLRPGQAPQSPIVETIMGLRGGQSRERLIIVSDMMQNSSALSFYSRRRIDFEGALEMCSMPDKYESIEVYCINRPEISVHRRQEARQFWEACLKGMSWKVRWNNF